MERRHLCTIMVGMLAASKTPALTNQTGYLNEPYLEWKIEWNATEGNSYDVIAHALFAHEESGQQRKSLMFYDGDNTWKFRFTSTELGQWKVTTSGPGTLGSQTATVLIKKNPHKRNGLFTTDGTRWLWSGSGEEFVPHFVMMKPPRAFRKDDRVDTASIDETIREFVGEHGFSGFHWPGGAGWWLTYSKRTRNPKASRLVLSIPTCERFGSLRNCWCEATKPVRPHTSGCGAPTAMPAAARRESEAR